MLRSMTAFSRVNHVDSIGRCLIEISSINRRHLEVQTFLPKELTIFDPEIRKRVQKKTARGLVIVKVSLRLNKDTPFVASANNGFLEQLKPAYKEMAKEFGLAEKEIALALLPKESNLILFDEDPTFQEKMEPFFFAALDEALEAFQISKEKEGLVLEEDLFSRMEKLKHFLSLIENNSENVRELLYERLKARIKEMLPEGVSSDERVLREACLLADKADITEEIVRLKSHIDLFLKTMEHESQQGKKLEFICQEIHREITTISSKTNETKVSILTVDFKSELEKIKEQLQNIE